MLATVVFLALLVVTIAWTLLPFVPAVSELLRPTDARPLDMVGRDSGDIAHFATGFRTYLTRHPELADAGAAGTDAAGALEDGTRYVRVSSAAGWALLAPDREGVSDALVVLDAAVPVPAGTVLSAETVARAPMRGGDDAIYRAVLADGPCTLGARSTVLRWVHARGTLAVGPGSRLFGRASSEHAIVLEPGVEFERLGAPAILAGAWLVSHCDQVPRATPLLEAYDIPGAVDLGQRNFRIDGDLDVPPGVWISGQIVARGDVRIAEGSRIEGSVKAHGDLHVAAGATIARAAVARGSVRLEAGARVGGPLIAEERAFLAADSWVGLPQRPTTVSVRRLTMEVGTRVFGRISAVEGGETVPASPAAPAPAGRTPRRVARGEPAARVAAEASDERVGSAAPDAERDAGRRRSG